MEAIRSKKTHIPALDGLRGLTVLVVCWYHIWQQSWLAPVFTLDLGFVGLGRRIVSLEVIPRTGYLFVDLMLLLSAFLLFLPHAEAALSGGPFPETRRFYLKRAARILPSYWLAAVLLFAYAAITGAYGRTGAALRDFFATATFTQTFSAETYIGTKINGVMWTAAVEVEFYLIFPLLARAFRKRPLFTWIGMTAIGMLYLKLMCFDRPDILRVSLNQLPAFFGVFANGMLAAYAYAWLDKRLSGRRPVWLTLACVAGLVGSILLLRIYLHRAAGAQSVQMTQGQIRQPVAAIFTLLVLSVSLGGKAFSAVFGNRVMRFLGAISYNLYLWHQWIAVRLKQWRIPFWTGDTPPNMTGDRLWQGRYTALCFGIAFAVAILMTYLVERPVSAAILKPKTQTEEKNDEAL